MAKYLEISRIVFGVFFLFVAVIGVLGMISNFVDHDISIQFIPLNNGSSSNAPVYYSACLFAGCWLLYGKRNYPTHNAHDIIKCDHNDETGTFCAKCGKSIKN